MEVPRGAAWACPGARHGRAQGRGMGVPRGAAWACPGARHGRAQGRGMGVPRGAAWACPGARHGRAQGRGMGVPRGAAWACPGARHGRAQGRGMGVPRGATWACLILESFLGYQNTLCQFYRDCDVYGSIDFTLDNAIAIFQNYNLYACLPLHDQSNVVIAQVVMQSFINDAVDPMEWLEWSGAFALYMLYYGEFQKL
ncbi:hypothetical protein ZIOFF_021360 [Zingiber officinale]|uniref:Pectinesterase catalytic domain-containing protein n=1 Tax=Zingiber officinale TaxID=94328 RepID=A0A8J5HIR7_ZINOF|nr:hypothetical protein ZIOFF_021360 [Zingiber officinale]